MGLISLAEIQEGSGAAGAVISEQAGELVNGASLKWFRTYIDKIEPGKHYHFWNGGQWSMQDLLQHLLNITGKASVWITTWSISEDAVRALLDMRNREMIGELKAVFDYKSKEMKTKAFLMARENFDVTLARIHAKVTCIRNENWCITITGSANWTRNPRAERQLLCTVPEIAEADIKIIESLAAGEHPFKVR